MNDFLIPGLIFGMVDNGVLILGAYTGLEIDRFFKGNGQVGAILGAGVGNTISDGLGAVIDPTMNHMIIGIILGCLIPLIIIPIIETRKNNGKYRNLQHQKSLGIKQKSQSNQRKPRILAANGRIFQTKEP